ncbi:hypothetical protein INT48_005352 [Thamnidium elegans]|uniref:Tc1-like transposase DDE domain-containing protein n=1 Tax=Thamnidium elegans TaxID=101142 RepID=A0A8H7SIL0_9FUNG|nr:hypothetical protein INT48_005352 [Thamnidium elegans]
MNDLDLEGIPLPNMVWTRTKYKPSQVTQFISLMQNNKCKVPKTAKETGYKPASEVKIKRNNVKITEEHSQFIEEYVNEHPTCIVKDVTGLLRSTFNDIVINESTIYSHITKNLEFTLTHTQPRMVGHFKRKCVFVDESGFKKNMVRPVAWSKKGTTTEVEVQPDGVNLTGRKRQKAAVVKRDPPHGTNSSHFLLFVEGISTLFNKPGLQNMYIVVDNAGIHKKPEVLQKEARKTPLQNNEILADRIEEAARIVSVENCRGWTRHSYNQPYNKEGLLPARKDSTNEERHCQRGKTYQGPVLSSGTPSHCPTSAS